MSGNQHPSVTDAPVETSAACPSGQAPVFEPVKGERSLLLHICCGPCSIMPVKRLQDEGFTVTAWYMNPNIQPLMEYLRRREAAEECWPLVVHDCCNRTKFARELNLRAKEGGWFGASGWSCEFPRLPFEAFLPTLRDESFAFLEEEPLPYGYNPGDIVL